MINLVLFYFFCVHWSIFRVFQNFIEHCMERWEGAHHFQTNRNQKLCLRCTGGLQSKYSTVCTKEPNKAPNMTNGDYLLGRRYLNAVTYTTFRIVVKMFCLVTNRQTYFAFCQSIIYWKAAMLSL